MLGDIVLNCSPQGAAGVWTCLCSAGSQSESFDADGTAAWDVCAAAIPRCVELVDPDYAGNGF